MKIVSVAAEIPEKTTSTAELEDRLGLERGWIERRTGILHRPIAEPGDATSDLAVRAGALALQRSGIEPDQIGLLLLATSTPDHMLPPTAPLVTHRLGLHQAGAVDVTGACAGFVYSLVLAAGHCQMTKRAVMVIGANLLSRRVNARDPATSALFSDGAGAVVVVPAEPSHLLGSHLGADGALYDVIGIPAGGSREPLGVGAVAENRHLMTIRNGSVLFKQAVHGMASSGKQALRAAGLQATDVDWWIPHQANVRIIRDAGALLGIPPEKTISVVDRYGNSSAATIPIALAHAEKAGQIRQGQTLLLTAAGAGMVTAAAALRW
jgi:3-oxoacyl-[acyl-carrier-protein] synthase III